MTVKNNLNKRFSRKLLHKHANMVFNSSNKTLLNKIQSNKIKKLRNEIEEQRDEIKGMLSDVKHETNNKSIEYNVFNKTRKNIKRMNPSSLNSYDKINDFYRTHYSEKIKRKMYNIYRQNNPTTASVQSLHQVYNDLEKLIRALEHITPKNTQKNRFR
jgi:hypothetical protein